MIAEYQMLPQARHHIKSQGAKTHCALNARQKWELFTWLKDNERKCINLSSVELAKEAAKSLGFVVTRNTVHGARLAVYPELKRGHGNRGSGVLSRIALLEGRIAALEQLLQAQTANTHQQDPFAYPQSVVNAA
jgi:hypothetical protein